MFLIIYLSFGTGELRSFVSVDLPEGVGWGGQASSQQSSVQLLTLPQAPESLQTPSRAREVETINLLRELTSSVRGNPSATAYASTAADSGSQRMADAMLATREGEATFAKLETERKRFEIIRDCEPTDVRFPHRPILMIWHTAPCLPTVLTSSHGSVSRIRDFIYRNRSQAASKRTK